jgi:hypothetical protein
MSTKKSAPQLRPAAGRNGVEDRDYLPLRPQPKGRATPTKAEHGAGHSGSKANIASARSAVSARVEAAARMVAAGWAVLPLHGKQPIGALVSRGLHDATHDVAQIERWLLARPDANVGAVPPEGCFVLDIDVYKDADGLAPLARRLAELATPMQTSGGGGRHFLLRGKAPSAADLRKSLGVETGIDVREHGKGYIVVAPSVHPETGAIYEWTKGPEIPVANAPHWLSAPRTQPNDPADDDVLRSPDAGPLSGFGLPDARDMLRYVPPAMWDDYDSWLRIGFALHAQFDGSSDALALWDEYSRRSPKHEAGVCSDKWSSMRDNKEANYTIRSLIREARTNGWRDQRAAPQDAEALRLYNPLSEPPKRIGYMLGDPVWLPDLSEQVSFFGKSESFKSVWLQGLCAYMAAGVALDGSATDPRVVVYAAEEAPLLWDNNLHAWRIHFARALAPDVYAHAVRNLEAGYLKRIDGNIGGLTDKRARELAELLQGQQRALHSTLRPVLALDPLAEVMHGDESKSEDMRRYISAGRLVQRVTQALVLHVHHTGHSNTDRERGSSTFPAAMFVRFEVLRPTSGAYVVELHCRKHKGRAKPAPSKWEVRPVEVLPDSTLESGEVLTGVVVDHIGEAAPLVSMADVLAEQQEQQLLQMLRGYRDDPSVGGKRLRELLGIGDSRLGKLREDAVRRALLAPGKGQGRAAYVLTPAGRTLVEQDNPDQEQDLLT